MSSFKERLKMFEPKNDKNIQTQKNFQKKQTTTKKDENKISEINNNVNLIKNSNYYQSNDQKISHNFNQNSFMSKLKMFEKQDFQNIKNNSNLPNYINNKDKEENDKKSIKLKESNKIILDELEKNHINSKNHLENINSIENIQEKKMKKKI